jgi:hypothetical protein
MFSNFLHSCSDLNSTASIANNGDSLASEVNVGVVVGAVGEETLVVLATGDIGPSPIIEVSTGIDEHVAFIDDIFTDFAIANIL